MFNIFLVEDDPVISGAIKGHLEAWGYRVYAAEDFKNITEQLARVSPQLVLLDISLPFFSGYYWCKEIRKLSTVPIIFISSASDNMNIVMAVNMGGDDFLAKPFDLSVLLAKVQAVLRRTYDFAGQSELIAHKGAVLNKDDNTLAAGGKQIPLTKNEYRILLSLMEKKGQIVSREALMERLWETDSFVDENTLTVNVTRLRKKLEGAGLKGFITTKKGIGYMVE
ncbi:MAG: response regulator transcription factor [Acutalibacteraceae bacterium]